MKKRNKNKSFCSDPLFYTDYNKVIQQQFKLIAHKRIDKKAIAELVSKGRYSPTLDDALLLCFAVSTKHKKHTKQKQKPITKKEIKAAQIAYDMGQAIYLAKIHRLVLQSDRAYATLKVIAEIKGLIANKNKSTNQDNQKSHQTNLNISLDPKAVNPTDTDIDTDNSKIVVVVDDREPLLIQ